MQLETRLMSVDDVSRLSQNKKVAGHKTKTVSLRTLLKLCRAAGRCRVFSWFITTIDSFHITHGLLIDY